ncbi:MAG: RrF2 family transcriptional regulator [Christensenellales bacterium]
MRISAKGRYALAATVTMAQQYNSSGHITVISIAEKLGISKIYLEQVFSLLKRGGLVNSVKGAQGGYQLTRDPGQISVLEVLKSVELSMFEKTEETVLQKAPGIEEALQLSVFEVLDKSVADTLDKITLYALAAKAEKFENNKAPMFYI